MSVDVNECLSSMICRSGRHIHTHIHTHLPIHNIYIYIYDLRSPHLLYDHVQLHHCEVLLEGGGRGEEYNADQEFFTHQKRHTLRKILQNKDRRGEEERMRGEKGEGRGARGKGEEERKKEKEIERGNQGRKGGKEREGGRGEGEGMEGGREGGEES
jgi:hypothetical protein